MALFEAREDQFGLPYWSVVAEDIDSSGIHTITTENEFDLAHFLSPLIMVKKRLDGPFRSELTDRDDVVLAFLSLFLLLIIDGFVATVLLRSVQGRFSNVGFSISQIVEFIREFSVSKIFKHQKESRTPQSRVRVKLLVAAVGILLLSFGLEMAVLILTAQRFHDVMNTRNTFRLRQPILPKWGQTYFHFRSSMNRPCQSVSFKEVSQAQTRINVCVSSERGDVDVQLFEKVSEEVTTKITTEMHEYGAEHTIAFGDEESDRFSTRGFFTLGDQKTRIMKIVAKPENEKEQVKIVHQQYIAHLFSVYKATTGDESVSIETLNAVKMQFNPGRVNGTRAKILSIPDRNYSVEVPSTMYETVVRGRLPRGSPALRVAQHLFAGSTAVIVAEGDTRDLFMETGYGDVQAVVWRELVRDVNWLTLSLFVGVCFMALLVLRRRMKPIAKAEIAGVFVQKKVGADLWRSPVEIEDGEREYFFVGQPYEEVDYLYGAETFEGWSAADLEYAENRYSRT